MTREEAINYFKRSYASEDTDDERQHNEALDMAIKNLEAWEKVKRKIKNLETEEEKIIDYDDGDMGKTAVEELICRSQVLEIINKYLEEV